MQTRNKFIMVSSFPFALSLCSEYVSAGDCEVAWEASSAKASCELTVKPIPLSYPKSGLEEQVISCEMNTKCLTGTTHPENSNSLSTREILDYKFEKFVMPPRQVKNLKNCGGSLRFSNC
ncbi:hypothetical protein ACXR0M_04730 [Pseudomonas sp. Eth.TT006]